ncbi:MAG TPA: PEP-CTERM sorting domain-containing protein [Candidatus Sulfotelmatobacter sp.]|nr:PEP-CTERM sorting domain-containing protein [Candidatus Sulfotelmatobacter sp.]
MGLCAVAILSFSSVALRNLAPSLFRPGSHRAELNVAEQSAQKALDLVQQESARELARRPLYPYSVVSGGVHSVPELKYAVERDPVVASHYAGFDYAHARVVQLLMERSVYVSYRIGNRVYWTRHRVKLKKGESLLTDGKMTARTRCANRVEEKPQQESSHMEPPAMLFDQPVMPAMGRAMETPPVPFQTSLERAAAAPGLPLGVYDPIGGGNWTPLSPPPLPNLCEPIKKPTNGTASTATSVGTANGKGKSKTVNPCAGGGMSEVPEPGTWLLVASGMAALGWKARQRFART